jgi:class 3 adenylate cyclase
MAETRKLAAILAADIVGYSRLAGADEDRTLARLRALRSDLIDPTTAVHHGRVVKRTGDGALVEFRSVVDAVRCAIEVQNGMVERNTGLPPERRIEFRIGIHLGDVVEESDGDLMGDGVNIAARLEGVADRGGICISRQVLDQVEGKLDLTYRELGRQNLKNITKPVEVYAIYLEAAASPGSRFLATANLKQEIRYCKAPDGVRLAYATVGNGPPMLRSAHWLGHLEYDWELPLARPFLLGLAKDYTLIRYDARGNGLSDWDVGEISLDAWVSDMETVADAAGLDRFPLLGVSQGCAVSIAYAVRHPERVSHLILYGGFAVGTNKRPNVTAADRERFAAMQTLVRQGWGADNPAFRQIFTSLMMPAAHSTRLAIGKPRNAGV